MMARIGWVAVQVVCALAFWVALDWGGEHVGLVRGILLMLIGASVWHIAEKICR
jgi:hypothetical protein